MTKPRKKVIAASLLFIVFGVGIANVVLTDNFDIRMSPYPAGKNFAFTITDDPDFTRLSKIEPFYELLSELGFRTTIAVWTLEAKRSDGVPDEVGEFDYGDTLQREEYRSYIETLAKRGFEIASHTASGGNDTRENSKLAYEEFRTISGYYPKIAIMHANNLDNIYWGDKVLNNRIGRSMLGAAIAKAELPFSGDEADSEYYWGDLLKTKTRYVRLWGTPDLDTLSFNPSMPYHDPEKPLVNYWFSFSDGNRASVFGDLVSKDNVDELVANRGASIVYTHSAHGFARDGEVDKKVEQGLKYIASQKDGWFVTASQLLDRLLLMKKVGIHEEKGCAIVANWNQQAVSAVTILLDPNDAVFVAPGGEIRANQEGELNIGDLGPYSSKRICSSSPYDERHISLVERIGLVAGRIKVYMRRD